MLLKVRRVFRKVSSRKKAVWMLPFLLLLSGCVYLRLLEFKTQLAQFDKNFWTEVKEGFVLHFNNPMLYNTDLVYLGQVDPSYARPEAGGERWTYRFKKVPPPNGEPPSGPDVGFEMLFQKQMLAELKFSQEFLEIIPPRFMELSLRALGNAKVDTKNRRVEVQSMPLRKQDFELLPVRSRVLERLGAPDKTEESPEAFVVTYRYHLLGAKPPKPGKEDRGIAVTTLHFDRRSEELILAKCKFAGLKISIDYKKWKDRTFQSTS